MEILRTISRSIPESAFKNHLRALKRNLFEEGASFHYSFKNKGYIVRLDNQYVRDIPFLMPTYVEGHDIFWWKHLEGYFQRDILKQGSVVIDAGAYPGFFTYLASMKVGENGKVLAMEPCTYNLPILRKILSLNGHMDNIEIIENAAYNKEGNYRFISCGERSHLAEMESDRQGIEVATQTTTIDSIVDERNLWERNIIIKMDIEGAEIEAVDGARETIKRNRPSFMIASYHIRDGEKTHVKLERFFRQAGYDVENFYPGHLTTYATPKTN